MRILKEVAFISLRNNIDPSTSSGRLMFQIIAVLSGHRIGNLSLSQVASDCANQWKGSTIARHEMVSSVLCCAHYS